MTGVLEIILITIAVFGFAYSRARAQIDRW